MPDDCSTLFVKNLPYTFKEDDVGDRFRRFGSIKSIRLAYNWMTKQSKGFAFIRFDNHANAKRALMEMNGKEVQGRRIKVDFDVVQEPKKGYKINLSNQDKNKLYNKDVIKEELSKRKLKAKEKQRAAMARMTK
jgi:RNA recognition motif-containing protein